MITTLILKHPRVLTFASALFRAISYSRWLGRCLVEHLLLRAYPRARAHFAHFVEGGGAPVEVDMATFLERDTGLRQALARELPQAAASGVCSGSVHVPQWRLSNRDYRFALGSLEVQWRRVHDQVVMQFRKTYQWHVDEARPTRGLHRFAESLVPFGARSYALIGLPCTTSLRALNARALSAPAFIPGDRLYM